MLLEFQGVVAILCVRDVLQLSRYLERSFLIVLPIFYQFRSN